MSYKKVNTEINPHHECSGVVLYCTETDRSIASFWTSSDAEIAVKAINNHDRLTEEVGRLCGRVRSLESALSDSVDWLKVESGFVGSPLEAKLNEVLNDE